MRKEKIVYKASPCGENRSDGMILHVPTWSGSMAYYRWNADVLRQSNEDFLIEKREYRKRNGMTDFKVEVVEDTSLSEEEILILKRYCEASEKSQTDQKHEVASLPTKIPHLNHKTYLYKAQIDIRNWCAPLSTLIGNKVHDRVAGLCSIIKQWEESYCNKHREVTRLEKQTKALIREKVDLKLSIKELKRERDGLRTEQSKMRELLYP